MKYQDHFPTIWDTPLKQPTRKPASNANAPKLSLKEVFLSIWGNAKRKPSA